MTEQPLLPNQFRRDILRIIKRHPGIIFSDIHRTVQQKYPGKSKGNVGHHVGMLTKVDVIKADMDGNQKRFYLTEEDVKPNRQQMILKVIQQHRMGITMPEIAKKTGLTERVVRYNLRKMGDEIVKERVGSEVFFTSR